MSFSSFPHALSYLPSSSLPSHLSLFNLPSPLRHSFPFPSLLLSPLSCPLSYHPFFPVISVPSLSSSDPYLPSLPDALPLSLLASPIPSPSSPFIPCHVTFSPSLILLHHSIPSPQSPPSCHPYPGIPLISSPPNITFLPLSPSPPASPPYLTLSSSPPSLPQSTSASSNTISLITPSQHHFPFRLRHPTPELP